MLDVAFGEMSLHRVDLYVLEFHVSALAMYKALGFKTEGHLVEARRAGGKYWNAYYMAMLDEEWLGHRSTRSAEPVAKAGPGPAAGTSPRAGPARTSGSARACGPAPGFLRPGPAACFDGPRRGGGTYWGPCAAPRTRSGGAASAPHARHRDPPPARRRAARRALRFTAGQGLFSASRSGRYFGGLWFKVFSERGPC